MLHASEEYDHMYDGASEAKDRRRGINPMNAEYVEKTNSLRAQFGFTRTHNNERTNMGIGGITPAQKLKMAA